MPLQQLVAGSAVTQAVFQVLPYKAWLTRYAAFHDLLASSAGMASCWYGRLPCSRRQRVM